MCALVTSCKASALAQQIDHYYVNLRHAGLLAIHTCTCGMWYTGTVGLSVDKHNTRAVKVVMARARK